MQAGIGRRGLPGAEFGAADALGGTSGLAGRGGRSWSRKLTSWNGWYWVYPWFYPPLGHPADHPRDPAPDRLCALPELSLRVVEYAREHGRVTIGDAIRLTGVSRNTLKQHFRNLVERGHLNQRGSGRGVWYELK